MATFLIQKTQSLWCFRVWTTVELWDNVKTDLSENTAAFSHEGYCMYSELLLFSDCFVFSTHGTLQSLNNNLVTFILHSPLLLSSPLTFHWSNAPWYHGMLGIWRSVPQSNQSIFHGSLVLNPLFLWQSCSSLRIWIWVRKRFPLISRHCVVRREKSGWFLGGSNTFFLLQT